MSMSKNKSLARSSRAFFLCLYILSRSRQICDAKSPFPMFYREHKFEREFEFSFHIFHNDEKVWQAYQKL